MWAAHGKRHPVTIGVCGERNWANNFRPGIRSTSNSMADATGDEPTGSGDGNGGDAERRQAEGAEVPQEEAEEPAAPQGEREPEAPLEGRQT